MSVIDFGLLFRTAGNDEQFRDFGIDNGLQSQRIVRPECLFDLQTTTTTSVIAFLSMHDAHTVLVHTHWEPPSSDG